MALTRKWRKKICYRKLLSKTIGKSACYDRNLNLISSLDAKISGCRHFAQKITHQACQTFPELGCQLSFVCFLWVTRGRSRPTKSIMISICNKSNVITETLSILILRGKFDPWYQFSEFIFPVHLFIYLLIYVTFCSSMLFIQLFIYLFICS